MSDKTILYIHGMGGGGDSRIPSILQASFPVVVRTYDFNPSVAARQIARWVEELSPALVIGESLGACHAIRIRGVPHLLVSPSLGGPLWLGLGAFLARIPGVTQILDRKYRPRDGDRQALHFTAGTMRGYRRHLGLALCNTPRRGSRDRFHAFFGRKDTYRRSGVVSIRLWEKYFGPGSYTLYDGGHFMEEEFIESLLVPRIRAELTASVPDRP